MQVDVTAFVQGVINCEQENKTLCEKLATKIYTAIRKIQYRGPVGRSVCDYDKLLVVLSMVEADHWIEWVTMWKYIGESLQSGITVGSHNESK